MRFVWDYNEKYLRDERKIKLGFFIRPILSYFRLWDRLAADRPEYLIANSKYTKDRIKKYYGRQSTVVYPPVNSKFETNSKSEISNSNPNYQLPFINYFLIISRLSAYKRIDMAIEAFNRLKLPLVIVGEGKERKRLKGMAGENVKFLGFVPDEKLPEIYEKARKLLFSPGWMILDWRRLKRWRMAYRSLRWRKASPERNRGSGKNR